MFVIIEINVKCKRNEQKCLTFNNGRIIRFMTNTQYNSSLDEFIHFIRPIQFFPLKWT